MSNTEMPFRWRSIALPALLPTLLFSIGEGAIIPIIPLVAGNLGATLAIAGLVSAALLVGELFGSVPSGWLVSRIGERPAMIGASLLSVIGLVICLLASNPWALGFGIFLIGLATAVFLLARHAFMTSFVPIGYRARSLSMLGGVFRAGLFIGPFLTAAAIQLTGTSASAFWIHLVACAASAVILIVLPDPTASFGTVRTAQGISGGPLREEAAPVAPKERGLFRMLYLKRGVLAKLGTGAALVAAMRASRMVIIPLWAVSIGMSETHTAIIIGIAGGIEFAFFYTGGQIMDRWGRLATALPSVIGLAAGHLILSFTHDLDSKIEWFIAAAIIMALFNGVGSGLLMTLGADLADKHNPAPFLGAWRFTIGLGKAGAPLAIAGITAAASLSIAAGALGVLGFIAAGVLARYVPRYVPRPQRPSA
jgi:MFS family permease